MARHVVVLSFDHWHLGYIGCYGNDWVETPHLDRLAMEGVVFDHCYGENFDPEALNHAWWTGRYQFPLTLDQQREQKTLADVLRDAGVATRLIFESDGGDGLAPVFDEIHSIPLPPESSGHVSDEDVPFSKLVRRAVAVMEARAADDQRSSLLWIKARGIIAPWLPPQEYADLYYSEFGLEETEAEPDITSEDAAYDPALLSRETAVAAEDITDLQYARAFYAACATHRDRWIGMLFEELQKHLPQEETLLIVTGAAGDHLGEHGPADGTPLGLFEEVIHVPLVIRMPGLGEADGGTRRPALVQSIDIAPTICDWLGVSAAPLSPDGASLLPVVREEVASLREAVWVASSTGERGVRNADHYYLVGVSKDEFVEDPEQLFQKPFDRWDLADLAKQSPGVVEEMQELLGRGPGKTVVGG